MNELVLRHELKHHINYMDYVAIRNRLLAITKQDSNVGADGTYQIRSLYFDNYENKALREKINGIVIEKSFESVIIMMIYGILS